MKIPDWPDIHIEKVSDPGVDLDAVWFGWTRIAGREAWGWVAVPKAVMEDDGFSVDDCVLASLRDQAWELYGDSATQ